MPNNQTSDHADTQSESHQPYSYTMQNLVFDRSDAALVRHVFADRDKSSASGLPSVALEDNRDKHMPSPARPELLPQVVGPGNDLSPLVKGEMEYLNKHPELIDIYRKTGIKTEEPGQHKKTEPNLVSGPDGKLHLKDAPIAPTAPTAPYRASDEYTRGHRPDPTRSSGEVHGGGGDPTKSSLEIKIDPRIIEAIKEIKLAPAYDRSHLRYPAQKSW